jgi:hypothetical protein
VENMRYISESIVLLLLAILYCSECFDGPDNGSGSKNELTHPL